MFYESDSPRTIFENHQFRIVLKDKKDTPRSFIVERAYTDAMNRKSWQVFFTCWVDQSEHRHTNGPQEMLHYLLTLVSTDVLRVVRGEFLDRYERITWDYSAISKLSEQLAAHVNLRQTDAAINLLIEFYEQRK